MRIITIERSLRCQVLWRQIRNVGVDGASGVIALQGESLPLFWRPDKGEGTRPAGVVIRGARQGALIVQHAEISGHGELLGDLIVGPYPSLLVIAQTSAEVGVGA